MSTPFRSPATAASRRPTAKPFDKNKSYPVRLSERLQKQNAQSTYSNTSLLLDSSVKFGPTAIAASIDSDPLDPDEISLSVSNRAGQPRTTHKGQLSKAPDSAFSLIFDPASQTLILDRIDHMISIAAPIDSTSPHDLGAGAAAGADRDASAHSDAVSDGSADPDNPYDWRHQYLKRKSSSPDAPQMSDRGESPLPVPTSMPALNKRRNTRKASTPPGNTPRSIESTPPPAGSDNDSVIAVEEPEVTSSIKKKRQPNIRRAISPLADDASDEDTGFSLELEDKPARGRIHHKALHGIFADSSGAPRSLASVASSRSRSRQGMAGRNNRRRLPLADDDGAFEIEMESSPVRAEDEEDEEDNDGRLHEDIGAEKSDLDVSEMEVGSPVHKPRKSQTHEREEFVVEVEPEVEPEAVEQEDEDDDDDMMEAFEEVFEQMDDGEEEPSGVAAAEDGDESEVSEAD